MARGRKKKRRPRPPKPRGRCLSRGNKVRWASEADALKVIDAMFADGKMVGALMAFECPVCGDWHLGNRRSKRRRNRTA